MFREEVSRSQGASVRIHHGHGAISCRHAPGLIIPPPLRLMSLVQTKIHGRNPTITCSDHAHAAATGRPLSHTRRPCPPCTVACCVPFGVNPYLLYTRSEVTHTRGTRRRTKLVVVRGGEIGVAIRWERRSRIDRVLIRRESMHDLKLF